MISNYFTLAALAREWALSLPGSIIRDAYSPIRDELTIELETRGEPEAIRISVHPGFHFIYRAERAGRPRSNVMTLFEDAIGLTVASVAMNPSDRILSFQLEDRSRIDVHLYGSQANAYLVAADLDGDRIQKAFKRSDRHEGNAPPPAKSLTDADMKESLTEHGREVSLEKRLLRLRPRFGKVLIREAIFRSAVDPEAVGLLRESDVDRVCDALDSLTEELDGPTPRIYRSDDAEVFSLVTLGHLESAPDDTFATVDEGVRAVVRERSRRIRLEAARRPLIKALERAIVKARKKAIDLDRAVETESRAGEYERWGHLLMANPRTEIVNETLKLEDILGDGQEIRIPVNPDLTVIENAERYYAKARSLRTERATLAERVASARDDLRTLMRLLSEVALAEDARETDRFRKVNAEALRRFIGGRSQAAPAPVPFRRFVISGGFEVWVGRNAQENDRLTFDAASPHDLWFHARGAAGSHVVLRIPGRRIVVGKSIREEAAAIAAWFSAARGSGLVPVIVTERKYVSKPKGSDPGAVRVLREDVLMVEPRLPA